MENIYNFYRDDVNYDYLSTLEEEEQNEYLINREYFGQLDLVDSDSDKLFEISDSLINNLATLEEAKESDDYNRIVGAVEEHNNLLSNVKGILGPHIEVPTIGAESIIRTPYMSLDFGIENIGDVIGKIYATVTRIIKWIMGKVSNWMKFIKAKCSMMRKDAETMKKNLQSFRKNNPNVNRLGQQQSEECLKWLNKAYPGLNKFTSEHLAVKPGVSGIGETLLSLPIKKLDIVYPDIDSLPLGNEQEFLRGLTGFYRGKSILNSPQAIKDNAELSRYVAATQKRSSNGQDVICKVYSVDLTYVYFLILSGSELSKFKPEIGKVKLKDVQFMVPDLKPEDINKMFKNDVFRWLILACDFIFNNVNKAIAEINKIAGRISDVNKNMDASYRKYKANPSNVGVSKCLNMYMKFCQKLVTKYQEGTVHGAVQSFRDLKAISGRLYTDLVASASSDKAAAADKQTN